MDIKTLPTILCYVSSATTLNTYSHITDEMQQLVAEKIDVIPRKQRSNNQKSGENIP